jgi:Tfp pilus assembly protein PilE
MGMMWKLVAAVLAALLIAPSQSFVVHTAALATSTALHVTKTRSETFETQNAYAALNDNKITRVSDEASVALTELWSQKDDGTAVIVFLRHFG